MSDTIQSAVVVQLTRYPIRLAPGRAKLVSMPIDGDVPMGMRDEIAEHYQVAPEDLTPHATTLDYLIAAAGACMAGTFAGRLKALGQDTGPGGLTTFAEGVIVKENGVLRVKGVHVVYTVHRGADVPPEKVTRAHDVHQKYCPVAASIGSAVELTSELIME